MDAPQQPQLAETPRQGADGRDAPSAASRPRYGEDLSPAPAGQPLTTKERQLRVALFAGAVLFAVEAAIYLPEVFNGPAETRPFAVNSVAKDVLFAALTALAAADIRRLSRLVGLVIAGHVVILILLGALLAFGDSASTFPPPRWLADLFPVTDIDPEARLIVWLASCAVATAVLVWLYRRALRVRFDLRYLGPTEHETVAALADAILDRPAVPPREIATAVDHYWDGLDITYKGRLRLALWLVCLLPLIRLNPPLPLMQRDKRRDFVEKRLLGDVATRKLDGPLRTAVQSSIRFAMQMVYSVYYNDRRTYPETGYVRYSERGHPKVEPAPHQRLRTRSLSCSDRECLDEDVVVVGSGAGGAVAASELVRRGRRVLIVERGPHVDRGEFQEDEARMYARLYSDGALQTSRDFTFQVLQGMCVGGTTVVNNGVCFDLPSEVLQQWNGTELDAGLPERELRESFAAVRALVGVARQDIERANPVAARINAGYAAPGGGNGPGGAGAQEAPFASVEANMHGCVGCGYCNIGCQHGRKLSMLDGLLPETQRWADREREARPGFSGSLEVLPDCMVTEVLSHGPRATGVRCRLRTAEGGTRRLDIHADTVVVAAGAIHSSRLLMQSGLGGQLVGAGLCANLGSHMTADFGDDQPLRAFDGLQMSHYMNGGEEPRDHVIETWFNPVMSQALVMPGWLGDHQRNMQRYDKLGALGVLVGSGRGSNHVLRRRHPINGSEVAFTPSEQDLRRLLAGLRDAGRVLLEAGARHVMPATFRYHELRSEQELSNLAYGDLVQDASDISVNTGHPQGGNAISRDPRKGVVDERFRVHGCENVYVCDASVFPTAVRVNPQLSVMALAHLAGSECIA